MPQSGQDAMRSRFIASTCIASAPSLLKRIGAAADSPADSSPPPAADALPMGKAKAAGRVPKPGDEVLIVHGWKNRDPLPGKVLRVIGQNLIDVEMDDGRSVFTITSSPHDPLGKLPDHWFFPE